MKSSDFNSKFIDNKNDNDIHNNNNDDDETDYISPSSSSSANNNESLASSLSSSSSSSPLLLNLKRKTIANIQLMKNKKRQRRNNNSVCRRVVQFVPNSNLMTDVAFPRKNAAIPHTHHPKKAKTKRMNQGGGDEDEDDDHQSSTTNKNNVLWYTAQEMQTFKYSFIRDVQRYEQQQQRTQYCCDYNNNGGVGDDGLERYTTYNRVRRRQKRKGMVQICQAVQAFDQSTLLPTTKVPPLTELLGQLLQRYHYSS